MTETPVRLGFAFSLGVATFFAPCALPLLPGYVAYFVGQSGESDRVVGDSVMARLGRGLVVTAVTGLGVVAVFALLAAVAVTLGTRILRNVAVLELVAGVALVGLGAALVTDRLPNPSVHLRLPERRRGPVGYFSFGALYAAAAAGCTGPLFVGVATLALSNPTHAVPIFGAYAAGAVSLLGLVTLSTALGRTALVNRFSASSERVTRLAGLALIGAGLVQLYYFLVVFDGLAGLG